MNYDFHLESLAQIQQALESEKIFLHNKYGIKGIGVFGSYVRNEQRPDSDVDILIELNESARISLLDLVDLEDYLSEKLGVRVDIALKNNLRKRIGKRILDEVIPV